MKISNYQHIAKLLKSYKRELHDNDYALKKFDKFYGDLLEYFQRDNENFPVNAFKEIVN